MAYSVTQESFESLDYYWRDSGNHLKWGSVFVLPVWLKAWWKVFGGGAELYLCTVKDGVEVIGIAPLMVKNGSVSFIGSADVCDYSDFVVLPGREADFFNVLLDSLKGQGINGLNLETLRPDSTVMTHLGVVAREHGALVSSAEVAVSFEFELPATWEEYLGMLITKQRHELRRKLRRLAEEGRVNYHNIEDNQDAQEVIGTFFELFCESRQDKAAFMTAKREKFFRLTAEVMAEAGLFRFGVLEFETRPVAMVMSFDFDDTIYLYNSGYRPDYSSLSVGIISKALCIKDSIKRGKKRFDFLKGEEQYKHHLGGKRVPLYNCSISLR
jgi:CelD/BcsL family acetyltransferase involved in cellulose biosynthesis